MRMHVNAPIQALVPAPPMLVLALMPALAVPIAAKLLVPLPVSALPALVRAKQMLMPRAVLPKPTKRTAAAPRPLLAPKKQ